MTRSIRAGFLSLSLMTIALIMVACGGGSEGTTIRQLEETREASATQTSIDNENAIATRDAAMTARAPEGTVFADTPPDRGHDSNITIPFGTIPPLGGVHNPSWQKCDVYDEPVRVEHAVHALEHGAVWITYHPDTDEDSIDTLADAAKREPFVMVSPYPDLQSPIVLTAWGIQLELESADDPRIEQFVDAFANGPQTPEPGANCASGVDDTIEG